MHERTWRDFGHNRSEALALAQGKSDYIWMMDADDTVIGTPEFRNLTADVYYMLIRDGGINYWRRQLFRDGVPWFYKGVLHEFPALRIEPVTEDRLYGDYYIHSRRLGARNKDPEKHAKDAEVLLAHVTENPDDDRSVFYLAQSWPQPWGLRERAHLERQARRWAAGKRRCTTPCSGSASASRHSGRRGPRWRTPICGPGSSVRSALRRCMRWPSGW